MSLHGRFLHQLPIHNYRYYTFMVSGFWFHAVRADGLMDNAILHISAIDAMIYRTSTYR